ncbi:hypothetical protein SLEP1_g22924 [Rubroshorea leprosula]|uniref:CCHC-type domain-containing protein n=1 Tax=Rubroshorea leprosula TaxID=152421 RepID=A0AAV5JL55_9ROSI|nr:hypothetical protein SLEP1_g22924 [Rubroshorea leprosula]
MATRDETPNSAASKHLAVTMLEPNITGNPISFNSAAFLVKLTPNNYLSWKAQFVSLFGGYELDGFLDGSHPCPVATEPTYSLWARQDQLLRHALITSVSENITPYIAAVAIAQQAWETLAKLYANCSRTRVITLKERLQTMKRDGHPVSEYLRSLKIVADELGTVDRPLSDDDLTVYILNGLGPEFREIAASLRTRPFPTFGRQSQWHSQQHCGRGSSNQSNRPNQHRRRGQGPRYPTRPTGFTCQLCGHAGHLARNCPSFRVQSIGPMANFASSSNGFLDDCLLDSGANNHVTTDLANLALHSEYNGPDELQIGDGTEHTFPAPFKHSCLQQLDFLLDSLDDLPSPPAVSAVAPHESLVHEAVPPATPHEPTSITSPPLPPHSPEPIIEPIPQPQPLPPPEPIRSHPMLTHSQNNIFKPKFIHQAVSTSPVPICEPTCVTQALKDPNWQKAMSEGFSALVRQGTWEIVPSTPDQHLIGCKWVFRIKRAKDGSIERYKARLVAKGFHQRPSLDYSNTFSPVIKPTTIRTVLSIAVSRNWPIRQLDVNNAFLHGLLEEKLFMAQPVGFVDPALPHHVCRLRKSIYGLKQALRVWFQELKQFIISQGFSHSRSDSSLFVYHRNSTWIYFLVYVDDILITGSDPSVVSSLINCMSTKFSIKDLGTLSYFLGIEAIPTSAGLFLSQHKYVNDLLHRFRMHEAKSVATPLATNTGLQLLSGIALSDAQFMHRPTELHWQATKRLLRYLRGTLFHGLLLRPQSSLNLHAYSDADWAGDRDTMVSTTGYIVFLGQNPISWRAAKQKAVAQSSTEAEYRALTATASKVVWIRHLLGELGISCSPSSAIFCDNIGATYLSLNPIMHSRMKHIAIDLHFVRDLVDQRVLHVSHIVSQDQLADGLTKPLSSIRFSHLRSKIGVANGTIVLRGRIKESKSPP